MARPPVAPLVLATALLAPAGADTAHHDFRSPSGRLGCAFYSDAQTPRQVRCAGSNDATVILKERGKARRIRATDTVRNSNARMLACGRSTRFVRLRCTSRRSALTCHGFTVSVEKQRVF